MARSLRRPPQDELRSYFVPRTDGQLPSCTSPCEAPGGHHWVHAYGPNAAEATPFTGKWLIYVNCAPARCCWGQVRPATEAGQLGIGAKVSTHAHMEEDPAGPWKYHVICVYTADFRDQADVLRVATGLKKVDAVRKMILQYKPDLTTLAGKFAGNAAGEIAIYECHPPDYDRLKINSSNLAQALRLMPPKTAVRARRSPAPDHD